MPTTATCTTKCNADCEGSCTATANVQCQESCQESSFETCRSQLSSDCSTQCNSSSGAIFCNGQYVDANDVNACVDALNGILSVHVTSHCSGDECTVQASGSVNCDTAPSRSWPIGWAGVGMAFVGVTGAVARRRRQAKGGSTGVPKFPSRS